MIALCVDDESLLLNALVRAVEKSPDIEMAVGFDDEIDALAWMKKNRVDIAFLDIELHEMNGLELAKKLLALQPDLSIVFCTGYENYAIRAMKMHIDAGYLVKPFRSYQVQEEIEHIKRKRASASQAGRTSAPEQEIRQRETPKEIRFKLMGELVVTVDGKESTLLLERTKKGAVFLEYLILNNGYHVPKKRLLNLFWSDYLYTNPDSALKTLVSRLRKTLGEVCENLDNCVVSDAGGYCFELLPGMSVDVLRIMQIFEDLKEDSGPEKKEELVQQLIELYTGDLYFPTELPVGEEYSEGLHRKYLRSVCSYLEDLLEQGRCEELIETGRKADGIDPFDEKLHVLIMRALKETGRTEEVTKEYERLKSLCGKYLNVSLTKETEKCYQELMEE